MEEVYFSDAPMSKNALLVGLLSSCVFLFTCRGLLLLYLDLPVVQLCLHLPLELLVLEEPAAL